MTAMNWLRHAPWAPLLIGCLTLGLSPFAPPHVVEKLGMLARGALVRPVDWFDLALHGTPWALLGMKAVAVSIGRHSPRER